MPKSRGADLARSVPTLVIAHYGLIDRAGVTVYNLASHALAAERYAEVTAQVAPLIRDWFGAPREKAQTTDLPNPEDDPFESGALLLTSLPDAGSNSAGLAAAHQLTHAAFFSSRPWIQEGLAHFSQALYLEQERGRKAAIDYMQMHRSALRKLEQSTAFGSGDESRREGVREEEAPRADAPPLLLAGRVGFPWRTHPRRGKRSAVLDPWIAGEAEESGAAQSLPRREGTLFPAPRLLTLTAPMRTSPQPTARGDCIS